MGKQSQDVSIQEEDAAIARFYVHWSLVLGPEEGFAFGIKVYQLLMGLRPWSLTRLCPSQKLGPLFIHSL